jgi:hypothetical protein
MCAYEHDFGDNYMITIVKTGLTTKKYVIVLSVLNLVSDFFKCNHPIVWCEIYDPHHMVSDVGSRVSSNK